MARSEISCIGDGFGLVLPDTLAALRSASGFLTDAFHASGTLSSGNRVARITDFEEINGGSTGRKALLSIEYDRPGPALHTDLFVKFSRDLDDPVRDRGKTQMEPEVRFAALTRTPEFPIAVPRVLFADYHRDTGVGILITERIRFGSNGIERQYYKCLDYEMPEPAHHYRAVLMALARLAGTHRAGRFPEGLIAEFPVDVQAATVGERGAPDIARLDRRMAQLAEFATIRPGLLPANAADPEFLARMRDDLPRFAIHEDTVMRGLAGDPDYVALCHWNANVDNAWFWRERDGELRCGLLDWGCAGQMNLGMAIWGAMSGAETGMWNQHLDDLLDEFAAEFQRYGGPRIDPARLRRHLLLYAAIMGMTWLLDVPALLRKRFGDDVPGNRRDPRIRNDESLRAPLQMLANLLNLWERHRMGELLDAALAGEGRG